MLPSNLLGTLSTRFAGLRDVCEAHREAENGLRLELCSLFWFTWTGFKSLTLVVLNGDSVRGLWRRGKLPGNVGIRVKVTVIVRVSVRVR